MAAAAKSAARTPGPWFLVLLGAICVSAALVLLGVTARWGPGVSADSVAYLDAARSLRQGDGLTHTADQPLLVAVQHEHAPYPLLFWAPLYPTALAVTSLGPWGLITTARVLNALLLAATVALVGWLVLATTRSRTAALLAAGALALSAAAYDLYSAVLSEPLFVLLSYVAIALAASYLSTARRVYLWGAATATALALLARFAGLPLLGAIVLPLLLYGPGGRATRLARSAGFTGLSVLPLVAWLARNRHSTGTATGREIEWHPISFDRLAHGVDEMTMLIVSADVPAVARGPLALAVVVAIAAGATQIRRKDLTRGLGFYLVASLLVYVVLYPAFLLVSISLLDSVTNLSHRFLFPVYPGLVVLAAWVLVIAFRSSSTKRIARIALAAGIVVFLCGSAVTMAVRGETLFRDGDGYSGRFWARSPAIDRIRALPPSTTIYSDRPELVYFLTRRAARSVPAASNPMTGRPNKHVAGDLRDLRGRLRSSDLFVLFTSGYRSYLVDARTLEEELGLVLDSPTEDASFLRGPGG